MTSHDGFTLTDLVSYDDKHNEANGADNRDGENHNLSWNCGVEGPTTRCDVLDLRARQKRNFLATLLLSQRVPMLLAGDEMGRTQQGNNNAYCQDNRLSWLDWSPAAVEHDLLALARRLLTLRRSHPTFRRRHFFQGRAVTGPGARDAVWFQPDGQEFSAAAWQGEHTRALAMMLQGGALQETDERGNPLVDDDFLLLLNAGADAVEFALPAGGRAPWLLLLDTSVARPVTHDRQPVGAGYQLQGRSLALLTVPMLWRGEDEVESPV